ncbi:hypothetical protein [Psychroserpens sp. SPM9]|uniref:hypothetical protein n=1 Tax=Psychroserpens sp. SPM9 TaxID=2975598 RepID=UPI0021A8504C|nr:hypothetical protein [Psychroserpens sp. SPM9]MDG5490608.1 hypothetical protein [Psychroserpens sp. SPM9]
MKTIIIYLILALLVWGCETEPSQSITISVLYDKTDSTIPRPELSHIKPFFDDVRFAKGKRQFLYSSITNTNVNLAYKSELLEGSIIDNNLERQSKVNKFYTQIDTLLSQEADESKIYLNSSIISPLVAHMETVSKLRTTSKVVLLYSDILEASDHLNVYTYGGQQLLLNNPEKVIDRFSLAVKIPDLKGVELYIIYYPNDLKDNRLFGQMCKVYEELFKDSGLIIHIGLTNTINF